MVLSCGFGNPFVWQFELTCRCPFFDRGVDRLAANMYIIPQSHSRRSQSLFNDGKSLFYSWFWVVADSNSSFLSPPSHHITTRLTGATLLGIVECRKPPTVLHVVHDVAKVSCVVLHRVLYRIGSVSINIGSFDVTVVTCRHTDALPSEELFGMARYAKTEYYRGEFAETRTSFGPELILIRCLSFCCNLGPPRCTVMSLKSSRQVWQQPAKTVFTTV
jgi:hypothetical protein